MFIFIWLFVFHHFIYRRFKSVSPEVLICPRLNDETSYRLSGRSVCSDTWWFVVEGVEFSWREKLRTAGSFSVWLPVQRFPECWLEVNLCVNIQCVCVCHFSWQLFVQQRKQERTCEDKNLSEICWKRRDLLKLITTQTWPNASHYFKCFI